MSISDQIAHVTAWGPGSREHGTAFLVSADVALTAYHVIGDERNGVIERRDVKLRFLDGTEVDAHPYDPDCHADADVATLRLSKPLVGRPVLDLQPGVRRGDPITIIGWPANRPATIEALTFDGRVNNVETAFREGRVLELRVPQASDVDPRGMSGAPVLFGDPPTAVGMVRARLTPNENSFAPAGVVLACPIEQAIGAARDASYAFRVRSPLPAPPGGTVESLKAQWQTWAAHERLRLADRQERLAVLRSPLERGWDDFVREPSWNRQIGERLGSLFDALADLDDGVLPASLVAGLRERLGAVDIALTYPELAQAVQAAITEQDVAEVARAGRRARDENPHSRPSWPLERVRRSLTELRYEARSPRFGVCFLVAGSTGEGKTHFLARLVERMHSSHDAVLPVLITAPADVARPVTEVLLETLNRELRTTAGSLEDIAWVLEGTDTRFVVCVDDVETWLRRQPSFGRELVDTIERLSVCHSFRWVVTVGLTALDQLVAERRRWRRLARRDDPLPSVDGWIVLDELNRDEQTGLAIMRHELADEARESLAHLEQGAEDAPALRYLSTPFTAWAVLELLRRPEADVRAIVDLAYVEFVERFQDAVLERYAPPGGRRHRALTAALDRIALGLAEAGRPTLTDGEILQALLGKGLELGDGNAVLTAVEDAEQAGMLARNASDGSIELRHRFLWELQVARRLPTQQRPSSLQGDAETAEWFEGILQFVLLLADADYSADGLPAPWDEALSAASGPPTAAWFAGPKARPTTQQALARRGARSEPAADRRSLFARMYCAAELPATVTPGARLAIMRRCYPQIERHGLSAYLALIAKRAIWASSSRLELRECLVALVGCEETDAVADIAATAAAAITELCNSQPIHELRYTLRFIRDHGRPRSGKRQVAEEPYNFEEWLLRDLVRDVAERGGPRAYWALVTGRWYAAAYEEHRARKRARENVPIKPFIPRTVGLWMTREANRALGHWYRHHGHEADRSEYLDLLEHLVGSAQERGRGNATRVDDRRNAIYLIKHTEQTEGRKQVRVDPVFHDLLERLRWDADLRRTVEAERGLFQANGVWTSHRRRHR